VPGDLIRELAILANYWGNLEVPAYPKRDQVLRSTAPTIKMNV
jgi:hypothetical protein